MSHIKLFSWNVNGIRAVMRKGDFPKFIESHDPDVLGLQETKAMQEQSGVELPQYHEYWNSADKKGYSGTAIFSRIEPITVTHGFPDDIGIKYQLADTYGDASTEGRIMRAEYEGFHFVTVYTPNAKDDLSRVPLRHQHWDPAFLEYMKRLEETKPVVFCGDLNVAHTEDDLARPKENKGKKGFTAEEREGIQNYIDAGFVDTLRLFKQGNGYYSWWTNWANARERNVGWRIDYVFVSASLKDKVISAEICTDVFGSDHAPVTITLNLE